MLLYVIVMFKPLIPIISDALSHTFAEAIHISTVHAIYGSNHLEKELANTSSDNANSKSQKNINTEDQVTVHISANECLYDFPVSEADKSFSLLKFFNLKAGFILKQSPPPKFY
ncbi:MAG: hypothetical protein M3Y85_00495 [Bacteroidota bacterium]|nr:hypothetical protein [Bacteroidota bacterium]